MKNHGIPESTIDTAVERMKQYFSLPEEVKMEVSRSLFFLFIFLRRRKCPVTYHLAYHMQHEITKTPNFKGYSAALSSNNDPNGAGDMHEGFEFGFEPIAPTLPTTVDGTSAQEKDGVMAGANAWPREEEAPGFREGVLGY